jgi:hypothetical protein
MSKKCRQHFSLGPGVWSQPYRPKTRRAADVRDMICASPFNLGRTVDIDNRIRRNPAKKAPMPVADKPDF